MAMIKSDSEYSIMDQMDEKQIEGFSEQLKKAMAYKTSQGKTELTFIGLKTITLKMSQKGQPLETIHSEVNLDKDDPENKNLWFWRATVKVKNQKTGLETEGISECPYFDGSKYDPFGRTKAHSKAERNAWRKQVPELEMTTFMQALSNEQVKEIDDTKLKKGTLDKVCNCDDPRFGENSRICLTCGGYDAN